jgi:hypothetical protein
MNSFCPRFQSVALVLIASLLLVSVSPVLAGYRATGELTPTGTVLINNAQVTSNVTLVSGSRVTTMGGSTAVADLGGAGQIFVNEKTDLMVNFEQTSVRIELMNGSVRVKTSNKSSVITKTCGEVEVMAGGVIVLNTRGKKMDELQAGKNEDYNDREGFVSNSLITPTDYLVKTTDCKAAAAVPGGSRKALFILLGAAGAAAAVGGGIAAGTGGGSTPPPAGGGTPSSPNNP